MKIDCKKLRRDMIDYYGTGNFSMAMIDVIEIERASEKKLVEIAHKIGINLLKYSL